jgi:hypothetical protein
MDQNRRRIRNCPGNILHQRKVDEEIAAAIQPEVEEQHHAVLTRIQLLQTLLLARKVRLRRQIVLLVKILPPVIREQPLDPLDPPLFPRNIKLKTPVKTNRSEKITQK